MQKSKFENLPNRLLLDLDENFMAYVNAANWLRQHLNVPRYQPQATADKVFEEYFKCKLVDRCSAFADFGPHYIDFINEVDVTLFLLKWK